ncbi:MAG: putative transposase [Pseudonocardiales bacterium]|nr:putative transposase [Pseudonocardiales bacterium]
MAHGHNVSGGICPIETSAGRAGTVALSVGVIEAGLGCEGVGSSSPLVAADVGVRWLPVPTGSDRRRGALVSAVQFVLSRRRGTAGRAWRRGRSRHRLPVGAAVHPLLADAARFCRHSPGDRWHVDETYVKVNGVWRYVYRAVDQYGQVIDVLVSARRDADAARRFFRRALSTLKVKPSEVGHRRRRGLPRRARRAHPFRLASRRAVRQQSDRG